MSDDYDRGYQDGLEAGREAKEHGRADTALGEFVGSLLGGIETVIAEQCTAFESDEYQEGFRQGVRDSWDE